MIHIRRVPFVENGEIVGLCAKGDLAKVNIHVNEAGEASSLSVPYNGQSELIMQTALFILVNTIYMKKKRMKIDIEIYDWHSRIGSYFSY